MKPLTLLLALLLVGCATSDESLIDHQKRAPTSTVEVFKDGSAPQWKSKVIAELSFLGPREEELRAQKRFIKRAQELGGNAIVMSLADAGMKGGGGNFSHAFVFRARVLVKE